MQPRVLFRTHYQVDEPALTELLVKLCTSPVRSTYNETVALRLAQEVERRGKEFNVAAAGYALDLTRGLGLVNDQNVWTEKGHLVGLIADVIEGQWEEQLALNSRERLLHFRLFLEADGAAILYISRYVLKHGRIPNSDSDWNHLATELFVQVFSECLKLSGTTADRVALRSEIDRIRRRGYTGKSGTHKMFIHLQTLHRLGLLDRTTTSAARQYLRPEKRDGSGIGLQILVEAIPDLYTLETIVKEHRVLELAAKVFGIADRRASPPLTLDNFLRLIIPVYQKIMATGAPLCHLSTLLEAIQVHLLTEQAALLSYSSALSMLREAQKEHLSDVRFHVDRRGAPAFLKLSERLLAAYS